MINYNKILFKLIFVSLLTLGLLSEVLAQKKSKSVEEITTIDIGYARLPGYQKGGFHFGFLGIMEKRWGFSTTVNFFGLTSGTATFINVNGVFTFTRKTVYVYPYAGLSLGIYSDKTDVGSYDPFDYLDGLNVGVTFGGAVTADLKKISLTFSLGKNTLLKSSSIMRFTIGYIFD